MKGIHVPWQQYCGGNNIASDARELQYTSAAESESQFVEEAAVLCLGMTGGALSPSVFQTRRRFSCGNGDFNGGGVSEDDTWQSSI